MQALAQIVYTASELDGVESVQITVNGEPIAWPKANLESTTGLLRTSTTTRVSCEPHSRPTRRCRLGA